MQGGQSVWEGCSAAGHDCSPGSLSALPAQIHLGDAGDLLKNPGFYIVVDSLLTDTQLGVKLQYLIKRKAAFEERTNDAGQAFSFGGSEADAGHGHISCRGIIQEGAGI